MPYHVTWAHELENALVEADTPGMLTIDEPAAIPDAMAQLAARAIA